MISKEVKRVNIEVDIVIFIDIIKSVLMHYRDRYLLGYSHFVYDIAYLKSLKSY